MVRMLPRGPHHDLKEARLRANQEKKKKVTKSEVSNVRV